MTNCVVLRSTEKRAEDEARKSGQGVRKSGQGVNEKGSRRDVKMCSDRRVIKSMSRKQ